MVQVHIESPAPVCSVPGGGRPSDLIVGERWDVFCAMPASPRAILDVGCGYGEGLQSYRQRGTRVVGVDIDPEAVQHASRCLDEAIVLDIEKQPWPEHFRHAFDAVVFCDCLEHLIDPWSVLRSVHQLLTPGGVVVASIPNIQQARILAKLAIGRFEYVEGGGTVQRGHIRFFTRTTVADMFIEAGYDAPRFFFPRKTFHLRDPERALNTLTFGLLKDFLYGSFTVAARPRASIGAVV